MGYNMIGMAKLGWHGTRKRASGKFQARWCDRDGLQSEGGFNDKTQAAAHALRKANEALNVKVGLALASKPIQEARDLFLNRRTKSNTRALNERRIDEFLKAIPAITETLHLTNHVINDYARLLEDAGHNPGGQHHHLKIVRAFTNFCIDEEWLTKDPFKKFTMPKSDYEGRPLTPAERDSMLAVVPRYAIVDLWLNRAFRFGHSTMMRIGSVWALTGDHFRAPNMLRIDDVKDQGTVWVPLRDEALAVLQEIIAENPIRAQQDRFFSHWGSVEAMRNSVEDKARRVGLPGVRFHDVCKVSAVSELSAKGVSPADIAHLSNTSKETLIRHYIKSDRDRAFANYMAMPAGHTRATNGQQNDGLVGSNTVQPALEGTTSTIENASTSRQIPSVRR